MWSHVKHKPEMQLEEFEGFFSFSFSFLKLCCHGPEFFLQILSVFGGAVKITLT